MSSRVFLPLVAKADPLRHFGAQIDGHAAGLEQWLVANRIYQIPVKWDGYENNQAAYDRDAETIRSAGGRLALGLKLTPAALRLWPEYVASPPAPTSYPALADFACMLARRYHPEYIELYNEPNVARDEARQFENLFGSWIVDGEDPELGGRRYGSMLRSVYPALQACGVRVYAGALMVNSGWAEFVRGVGDAPCDAISWHCYLTQAAPFTNLDARIEQLRQATGARLAITETSILASDDSLELQQRQAAWLYYLVDASQRYDLVSVTWYTLGANGWMCSDLVRDGRSTLAWDVFAEK